VTVTKFRISEKSLLKHIQQTANNTSKIVFIPPIEKSSMAGMMTFQQAVSCLRHGVIVGKPKKNMFGDWELQMERYAANFLFRTKVVVECDGALVHRLIIILKPE
jgi:hypothetical protein